VSIGLLLGVGLFWTTAYVLIIRQGFRDRTYGMPIVALCANMAWEFIFSVVRPPADLLSHTVFVVWLCFDLGIAYTVVRFGRREFSYLSRSVFLVGCLVTFALSYLCIDLASRQLDAGGPTVVAFAINLMMSGLFLGMLAGRGSTRGQSPVVAAAKLVGTLCASLYTWDIGWYPHWILMPYLYVASFVVDLAYLVAVLAVRKAKARTSVRVGEPVP
jgi:hypothetical protein